MSINKKYFHWVDKNISNISEDTKVLVIGATGSIGSSLCNFLSYKKCKVVLAGRNVKYLTSLKDELENKYHNEVSTVTIDLTDVESVDRAIDEIKSIDNIDCIINNAGIYHQDKRYINDIEITYLVNYLMPVYLFESLLKDEKFKNVKIINVGSITYNDHKYNFDDFTGENLRLKTGRYSMTKRLLTSYTLYLKTTRNINAYMVHPGVSTTNLFSEKNKAYPKLFYIFIVPIMKVFFMNKDKASLSLLKAIDVETVKDDEWIGPRGLCHAWGYPSVQKLKKSILNNEEMLEVKKITDEELRRIKR